MSRIEWARRLRVLSFRLGVLVFALLFLAGADDARSENVILFIGDGMGPEQVKAARYYNGDPLSFENVTNFPYTAECMTYSADNAVTDSAAAGTAIATGVKVNNGVISLQIPGDGSELETILEFYQERGKKVGLITTAYLTHATPAAFGAHATNRSNTTEIGEDLLNQTLPNILFGGGGNGLDPTSAYAAGYEVATTTEAFQGLSTTADYLCALFGDGYMAYEEDHLGGTYPYPHLTDMVVKALAALESHPDGFFLMVEGARIDHAGHSNLLPEIVHETLEFSRAVQAALNWASARSDTTILVTADHETGGLLVTQDNGAGVYPYVTWSTTGHTGVNVPVYASGPNAELVSGTLDNTDFFNLFTAENTASPILSRVAARVIDNTTVEIAWSTDVSADSMVQYRLAAEEDWIAVYDAASATEHAILLTGLTPGALYAYHVSSDDGQTVATSAEYTFTPTSQLQPVDLIAEGSIWRYDDTGTDLGTEWRATGYDDAGWASGPAKLGYGDGDEVTEISYGSDSNNKYPCYYFRHTFAVQDPAAFDLLNLRVLRDDGCVVYLNGQEVARYNMPSGEIWYGTYASTPADYPWDAAVEIPNLLVAGNNVIAVEVHQANGTSSDVCFDLELSGLPSIAVHLQDPADGATEVPIPAVLSATVTHPDGSPVDVDFYGRPVPSGTETLEFQRIQHNLAVLSGEYTSAQWDGLAYATDYEWYVVGVEGVNETFSEVRTFTSSAGAPPTELPAPPTNLAAAALSTSTIRLSWTDQADNEAGFDVESSVHDEANYGSLGTVGPDTTSIDVAELIPDTRYYYRVFAWNAVGESAYSDPAWATTFALPQADDQSVGTPEDTPLLITLNGTSPQDLPLSYVIDSAPMNGSLGAVTDNKVEYTPDLDYFGADEFSFHVSDGDAVSASATVAITVTAVNDPPVAQDDSAVTFQGVAVTIDVLANDADAEGDELEIGSVTHPSNGSVVVNPDQTITYAPDAGFNGLDSFTYTVTEVNDGTMESVPATVTVEVIRPILFYDGFESGDLVAGGWTDVQSISDVITDAAHDGAYGLQLKKSGSVTKVLNTGGAPKLQISYWRRTIGLSASEYLRVEIAQDGGPWSIIDQATGSSDWLRMMHELDLQEGVSTVSLRLSLNGNGGNDIAYLDEIEVSGGTPNSPPIAGDDAYAVAEDEVLTVVAASGVLANDSDAEGNPLTAVLVVGPANGTLALSTDGSFTYTPAADFAGTDSFTYKANDGLADSEPATATITVTAVNDPPVAADDAYSVAEDGTLSIAAPGVLANDTDADVDTLTSVLVGGPSNGSLTLNADGSFTYTPAANFAGTDSFTYKANDGLVASAPATATITVTAVNDPPVAVDDAYSVAEDGTLTVAAPGVLVNDSDAEVDTLTAALVSGPANGTLTLSADGSFTYTPAADFAGTDSFTYMANDSLADSEPATVTITVTAVNDAPVAADDSATTSQDTAVLVDVLANDTDVDGDALMVSSIVSAPANGTAVPTAGGISYTPQAGFSGTDSFTYRVSDGTLADEALVTVTVEPAVDATMHVASILVMAQDLGRGLKTGYAEVVMVDGQGNPVAGATVTGTFTEDIQSTQSGTTGADGKAVIQAVGTTNGRCHLTFTVDTAVCDGFTYNPAANVATSGMNH